MFFTLQVRASIVSPEASTRYRPNNYEIQIPCLPTDSFKGASKMCRFLCTWWGLLKTYHNPKQRTPGELKIHPSGNGCIFSFVLIPCVSEDSLVCPQASCREETAFSRYRAHCLEAPQITVAITCRKSSFYHLNNWRYTSREYPTSQRAKASQQETLL